jgi:ankyrin repeat protein
MTAYLPRVAFALTIAALLVPVQAAEPDRRLVNAAAQQDKRAIATLLKAGADVNQTQADGSTPLLWAAHWNDLETADGLIAAHAKVNAASDRGVTPLALAAENSSTAMVQKLLKAGADPNLAQSGGVTPLMLAARAGNVDVVTMLLGSAPGITLGPSGRAHVNAAIAGTGQTALMWAVAERRRDVVRLLVDAGADVHAASKIGFTPLLFAARNGDIDTASLLIKAGVGVNEAGSDGTEALPLAIVSAQPDFALFLLDQGANANARIAGVRALHAAAGPVDMWMRDWLRARGIDSVFGSGIVGLPLDRRLELVKALLARGADPNARTTTTTGVNGWLTTKNGAFEPFSVGTGDLKGATPLWVAAFAANRGGGFAGAIAAGGGDMSRAPATYGDILKVLLAAGADLRLTTDDKTTPLMAAAGLGQGTFSPGRPRGGRSISAEQAVAMLIDAGADVNAVNEAKFTALHGAAFRGLNEVIEYLVKHGADINAQDFMERTAFRIAEGSKQTFQFQEWPETAEFIKKLGADTSLGVAGRVQERQREVGNKNQ